MRHARRVFVAFVAGVLLATGSVGKVQATDLAERCRLEPVNGSCKARITKARFDQNRKKCVKYAYDGCGTVVPFNDLDKCQALCEVGEDIRLAKIRRIDDRPYAVITVEYPKSWPDELTFSVLVNGQPTDIGWVGSGYSRKTKNATLQAFMGDKPVRDVRVTTVVDGKRYGAGIDLHWSFPAMALLLDRPGNRDAVFDDAALRFFLFKAHTLRVHHNGKPLVPKPVDGIVRHGEVRQVTPAWRDGLNTVTLTTTAADGSRLERSYTFVFLGGGPLVKGETANVVFGYPGHRGGPYFRIDVDGDAVTMEPSRQTKDMKIVRPGPRGWLFNGQVLTRKIIGSAPGEATLKFFETPAYREPERRVREYRIRVVERDPEKGKEPQ
jgi:hypothetical protein